MAEAARPASMIRVVLAGFPSLTAASIRGSLVGHTDILILHEPTPADAIDAAGIYTDANVVLTPRGANGVSDVCCRQLFDRHGVAVIAVADDGRLEVYDKRVIRQASVAELLAEIRRVGTSADLNDDSRGEEPSWLLGRSQP